MPLSILDIFLISIYFAILLAIGYFSRKETDEGFLLAERKVKWPTLTATISASYFGGGALVLLTTWAFKFGISVIWVFLGVALGFLIYIVLTKKLKGLADEQKFYTISDYVYYNFDKKTGIAASIAILIYFFTWILLQFMAGGLVLSHLMGITYWAAVLITGGVVLAYLLLAGFKAVVKTDFFQYFIMLLFGILIVFVLKKDVSFSSEQFQILQGAGGITGAVSFLIMGIFITLLSGDIWQRIYSAKSISHAKKGLAGAFISILIIGFTISLLGLLLKASNPALPAENALMAGFEQLLPAGLFGIGLLVLFSSIMSTTDTLIFVLGMILSRDLLSHFKKLERHSLVQVTRVCMIVITLFAVAISLLSSEVASLGLLTAASIMVIGPAVLWSFFRKAKSNAAFYSIMSGLIAFIAISVIGITEELVVVPFLVSLLVFIIGQAVFKTN